MAITKSALSQQLCLLKEKGYIVRKQDDQDKGSLVIKLANLGVRYKEAMDYFYEKR